MLRREAGVTEQDSPFQRSAPYPWRRLLVAVELTSAA
jgi:hypothetical protein